MLKSGAIRFPRISPGRRAGQEQRLWRNLLSSLAGVLARALPEREILLRSNGHVRFVRLSRRFQLGVLGVLVLCSSYFIYAATNYAFFEKIVTAKDDEIGRIKQAYLALQSEVAHAEARFNLITQQLEAKHAYLLSIVEQNGSLRDSVSQTPGKPQLSEAERNRLLASREALNMQLRQLEDSLRSASAEKKDLLNNLDVKDDELQLALAERSRILHERNRLQARADELERRLSGLEAAQQRALDRITSRTVGSIEEARKLIAMTGLNADRLLARMAGGGLGGPFVAAPLDKTKTSSAVSNQVPAAGMTDEADPEVTLAALNDHIDHWDDLRLILRRLPFAVPVDNYSIASSYGRRRDPFNNQWAVHDGVDLAGPAKSPIYSTAPGKVIFAGRNGGYGTMVEIDHGLGIVTRYGHLYSAQVRKGQRVGMRQKIGLMGTSGRSTGVHLHYEVLVNGKSLDPMKFIKAGRYVFKG